MPIHCLSRSLLPALLPFFILAGCGAPAAPRPTQLIERSAAPTRSAPYPAPMAAPSSMPYPAPPLPTAEAPYPIEEPIIQPVDVPTRIALPRVEGEVVLKLTPGTGLVAFRIGGDGTIRLLDNQRQRILFFDQQGKLLRSLSIAEAANPVDFIVNPQGAVFVFDRGDGLTRQVLRYTPNGKLAERLPLGTNVDGDAIMLTADQDLLLVSDNQIYWSLIHKGVVVAPELQSLTMREGSATPRSPLIFRTIGDASGRSALSVESTTSPDTLTNLAFDLPNEVVRFFNIDRAMNLYFSSGWGSSELRIARVLPDGTVAGGAQIQEDGCQLSWRQFYIDQPGSAWSLCVSNQAATVKRYRLLSPTGQPLPEASKEPADVIWRPGAQVNLSSA